MKETGAGKDQPQGWIEKCSHLISLLEEIDNSLVRATGKVYDEDENTAKFPVIDKVEQQILVNELEQRISNAIVLAESALSRLNQLVDRF